MEYMASFRCQYPNGGSWYMSEKPEYTPPFKYRIQEEYHPIFVPMTMKATDPLERIFNGVEANLREFNIMNIQDLMLATRTPGVVLGTADRIRQSVRYSLSLQAFQGFIPVLDEAEAAWGVTLI